MTLTAPPRRPASGRHAARRPGRRDPRGRLARFVDRYGWRAYALPVLTVITIGALVHDGSTAIAHPSAARPDRVEGVGGPDFRAGAAPAPVVVDLKSDAVTSCADNHYRQLILVSIERQRLWACDGAQQVDESAVTTGSVVGHDQTPVGSWRVQAKQRDRYLVGPGYRDYVRYWLPFNGDFGLHDAPWQTMPFGSGQWPTQGSHGCVHTPTSTMAWIYQWATVGGTVVTVEQ